MIIIFILVAPLFYSLINAYRKTYIELVRLCIFTLDPITAIFSESLTALNSIRAYRLQKYFKKLIDKRISIWINLWSMRNAVFGWFDCYMDLLIDTIVLIATIFGFYFRDNISNPALVAFAIVYLNIISGHLQMAMLQMVWLESEFGSIQRLLWYHPQQNNMVYEANPINDNYKLADICRQLKRPSNCNGLLYDKIEGNIIIDIDGDGCQWPMEGQIDIHRLCLRYRSHLPLVLNLRNIHIKAGEKIGICGRTGAGKSSLMVALFRLFEPEECSSLIIDGVECTRLGLYELRRNLSIIPQDPILFMGSLRFNLDPFNAYTDEDVWDVLRKCALEDIVRGRENGLMCKVFEDGSNFSHGQKQLICIARALLKKTKVLVLDEATSSIDKHTDFLIQKLIRQHFKSTTVLCIAHRLETIVDYDRILVLKNGEIFEFDTPQKLMMKGESGIFAQMLKMKQN